MATERKTEIYFPEAGNPAEVQFMAIAAHHDDIEIMAGDGIARGQTADASFFGIVVTDGAGSVRAGKYAKYSDEQMKEVRKSEQKAAAAVGRYKGVALLNFPSQAVKVAEKEEVRNEIGRLLLTYRPKIIYTHNLCDKHPTHIAVALRTIEALRAISDKYAPKKLYGCEVWRDLDWLSDRNKTVFDLSGYEKLLDAVLSVHDSQIAGGKRYDLATAGRRRANATYAQSHALDSCTSASYAMDMTELLEKPNLSPCEFALKQINCFYDEVREMLCDYAKN